MFMVVVWMGWGGVEGWCGWGVGRNGGLNRQDEGLCVWEIGALKGVIVSVFAFWNVDIKCHSRPSCMSWQ